MWEILWFLIVGAAAGWLAGLVMKGRGFGLIGNLVVGILGAVLGGFIFRYVGLSAGTTQGSFASALVGAVVLLWIAGLIRKKP